MSNLMEVIKSRRSTRAFKSELPPKDQIMQRSRSSWPVPLLRQTIAVRSTISTVHQSTLSFPTSGMSTTLW